MIIYSEYDLLELFEREPIVEHKDQGFYMNSKTDKSGMKLLFSMSVYKHNCSFMLINEGLDITLVEIEIDNVIKLKKREETLLIDVKGKNNPIKITFKPGFSFNKLNIG